MKYYKYVKILEPDPYYGGPEESILFYCTDKSKYNKIKEYLTIIINKMNTNAISTFNKNKKDWSGKIYTNKTFNVVVYYINDNYVLFNKKEYIKDEIYYLNNNNENIFLRINFISLEKGYEKEVILPKITKKEFENLDLKEVCYYKDTKERVLADFENHLYIGNYSNFNPTKLKIKDIEKNYKLIEIEIN